MRAAHIERMRAMYTDTWCNVRNHPCDPEVFDERVDGEVATDARGDTIAFVLAWDNPTSGSEAERRPARAGAAPDQLTEVVYVYTGLRHPDTMRYREVGRRDFEARFGPGLPRRAIEPAVVRALFGPRPAP